MADSESPFFGFGTQFGVGLFGVESLYEPISIENQDPLPGAVDVPSTKIVEFDLVQGELPILLEETEIYIAGEPAYSGAMDAFIAPYDGAGSVRTPIVGPPAGHHFAIQKTSSWLGGGSISVHVLASDGNTAIDQSWSFLAENLGPLVVPVSPLSGAVEVDPDSNILLKIQDNNGVDMNSVRIFVKQGYLDWEIAFDGSAAPQFQPGWDGPGSSVTGTIYDLLLTLDKVVSFYTAAVVSVWVFAQDPSGETERL